VIYRTTQEIWDVLLEQVLEAEAEQEREGRPPNYLAVED